MFLEFNPVDVARVTNRTQIPSGTAREEHVFLVRCDSGSEFEIRRINARPHIPRFGPKPIRSSQGEVQVRFRSELCSWFNGVEYQKGFIRGDSWTVAS